MKVFLSAIALFLGIGQIGASNSHFNPNGKTHVKITVDNCESDITIVWDAEYESAFNALNETVKIENSLCLADECDLHESELNLDWNAEMDAAYKGFSLRLNEIFSVQEIELNENEHVINATVSKVYQALVTIEKWPSWMNELESAKVDWNQTNGTAFSFRCNGRQFVGELIVLKPSEEIAWIAHNGREKILVSYNLEAIDSLRTKITVNREVRIKNENEASFSPADQWIKALKSLAEKHGKVSKDFVL